MKVGKALKRITGGGRSRGKKYGKGDFPDHVSIYEPQEDGRSILDSILDEEEEEDRDVMDVRAQNNSGRGGDDSSNVVYLRFTPEEETGGPTIASKQPRNKFKQRRAKGTKKSSLSVSNPFRTKKEKSKKKGIKQSRSVSRQVSSMTLVPNQMGGWTHTPNVPQSGLNERSLSFGDSIAASESNESVNSDRPMFGGARPWFSFANSKSSARSVTKSVASAKSGAKVVATNPDAKSAAKTVTFKAGGPAAWFWTANNSKTSVKSRASSANSDTYSDTSSSDSSSSDSSLETGSDTDYTIESDVDDSGDESCDTAGTDDDEKNQTTSLEEIIEAFTSRCGRPYDTMKAE